MEMLERNGRTEAILLIMVARLQYLRFCLFEMYVNVVFVIRCLYNTVGLIFLMMMGAGIAQWLERRTRDRKVAGSNPRWSGGRIFFSRVNFLC